MRKLFIISIAIGMLSCNRVKETAKETINKGGEITGKTATEFIEGFTEGIEQTLESKIVLSKELENAGVEIGKSFIASSEGVSKSNLLTCYMIFNKDFEQEIVVRVNDKHGNETGRSKQNIKASATDAQYVEFEFDKRTHIEVRSKILMDINASQASVNKSK